MTIEEENKALRRFLNDVVQTMEKHHYDMSSGTFSGIAEYIDVTLSQLEEGEEFQAKEMSQVMMELNEYRKEFIPGGERFRLNVQIRTMRMALELISMTSKCGHAIEVAELALRNIQGEKTEGGG